MTVCRKAADAAPNNYGSAYAVGGRGPCAHCAHWQAWQYTLPGGAVHTHARVAVCGRVPGQPMVVANPALGCAFFQREPGSDDA